MVDPIISFYKQNDVNVLDDTESDTEFLPEPYNDIGVALHPQDFGSARAGESTPEYEIHIYNNKGGNSDVDTAFDLALTVVNILKENQGGELIGGKEIVEMLMAQVKNVDIEGNFQAVGGMVTIPLGNLRGDKLVTPNLPLGTAGHDSGGQVLPGTYYGEISALDETGETLPSSESTIVEIDPLFEELAEDGNSENLSPGANSRISYTITGVGTYVNGFQIKQNTGGTLVGNLRLETDNAGNPSGTLVSANAEKLNVTLNEGLNSVFFNNEITWENGTTYHLVFVVTGGAGQLKGKATGSTYKVKYYDGSWHNSSSIYDLYCVVIGDNLINWSWDTVTNAMTYKLFRTEETGVYGANSLIAQGITDVAYQDKVCEPVVGEPLAVATVTYQHKRVVKIKMVVNSNAQTTIADFFFELRYNKA